MNIPNSEYKTPNIVKGSKIPKGWGYELILENNENYCGKLLVFEKNHKFSMHFHMKKKETWYVQTGTFTFKWIDARDATEHVDTLTQGDVVTIYPGQPHQLITEDGGIIFEVSTTHYDEDSYRIFPGNSQNVK